MLIHISRYFSQFHPISCTLVLLLPHIPSPEHSAPYRPTKRTVPRRFPGATFTEGGKNWSNEGWCKSKKNTTSSRHIHAISHHSGDSWMYPYQRTPMGNPYISPISTMGTLLGVHPIVPWIISPSKITIIIFQSRFCSFLKFINCIVHRGYLKKTSNKLNFLEGVCNLDIKKQIQLFNELMEKDGKSRSSKG